MMEHVNTNEPGSAYGRKLETDELENVSGGTFWEDVEAAYDAAHPGIGTVAANAATQPGIGTVVMDTILHPK
jgi:hypothetical protein